MQSACKTKMQRSEDSARKSPFSFLLFLQLFVLTALFASPRLASAALCLDDNYDKKAVCTAEDVQIAQVIVNQVIDGCDPNIPNDTATIDFDVVVQLNASDSSGRFDSGIYIAQDGGDALTGQCVNSPLPLTTDTLGDGDSCGDLTLQGQQVTVNFNGPVEVACVDSNGDGALDLPSCVSWKQPGDNDECNDISGAVPGTPSKCKCETLDIPEVPVGCQSDADCDDGAFCNGAEICLPDGTCSAGTAPSCDDGVSCTVDACDEDNDTCTNTPDDSQCTDGLYCNGTETCDPVNGCQAGTAPDCSDGVSCTVDACDEDNDTCTNTPDDSQCNDGLYCNGTETCDPVNGCQAGTAPDCSDGVSCTVDACDEANDVCTHTPDDSQCNDSSACTTDSCDAVLGCVNNSIDCDDGNACTADSCNPTSGCVNTDTSAQCNDGLYCNGTETCDPVNGCQAGTAPDCSDGVSCTVDACDEDNDTCTNTPDDSQCNDGLYCNGTETCDPVNGCQAGTAPDCSDGVSCTVDACDEANDVCTHTPDCSADNLPAVCCDVEGDGICKADPNLDPVCAGLEGCTPGFWKNNADKKGANAWPQAPLVLPSEHVSVEFTIPDCIGTSPVDIANSTLLQALSFKGGSSLNQKAQILLRAAVAAKLNALSDCVTYPQSIAEVLNMVNQALATCDSQQIVNLASELDRLNNLGCPLNQQGQCVGLGDGN
ncbi:MAG: hypothetical protein AB7G75_03595 [Candidatus Binatia bacterium]